MKWFEPDEPASSSSREVLALVGPRCEAVIPADAIEAEGNRESTFPISPICPARISCLPILLVVPDLTFFLHIKLNPEISLRHSLDEIGLAHRFRIGLGGTSRKPYAAWRPFRGELRR